MRKLEKERFLIKFDVINSDVCEQKEVKTIIYLSR
jgi:hypothetical protein